MKKYIAYILPVLFIAFSCKQTTNSLTTETLATADSIQDISIQKLYDGLYTESITLNKRALQLYTQANDSLGISDCMANISICYTRLGDMSSAIDYANKALQIDLILDEKDRISSSYNTLSGIYLSAKDPYKAQQFIRLAIQLEESLSDSKNLSIRYGMASEIYLMLGQKDSSLYYANKAFDLDYQHRDTIRFARRLAQIADGLSAKGSYQEAEAKYLESLQWLERKPSPVSRCIVHKQMGNLMRATGRPQMAVHFFEQAVREAKAIGNIYILQFCCDALSELLETKNPSQALHWLRNSVALKDSLYSQQTAKLTSSYAAKYDLAEKRHTIHAQEDKLKLQKLGFIIALITCTLLIIICILLVIYIKQKKRYHSIAMKEMMNRLDELTSAAEHQSIDGNQGKMKDKDVELLCQLKDYIQTHLSESTLNSESIAASLCISQRHLNRRVKELTGQDTGNMIRTMRIQSAMKLLADFSLNITDIYTQCGFESPSYFSKVFKEITGVTPTTYRKQLQIKNQL